LFSNACFFFFLAERKRECEEGNVVRIVGSFNSIVVRRYDEKFSKIKRTFVVLYVQYKLSGGARAQNSFSEMKKSVSSYSNETTSLSSEQNSVWSLS
jgi:hypothetical protein